MNDERMTDRLNSKCLSIMRHLLSDHPVAEFFKDPVDTSFYPDYKQIVSKPSDISTIKRRLKSKRYTRLSEWNHDVELIFKNCEMYNGRDSIVNYLAMQLKIDFEKLKKKYLSNTESLTKRVEKLQAKLDKLLTPGKKDDSAPELPAFVEFSKKNISSKKIDSSYFADQKDQSKLIKLQEDLEKIVDDPKYSYSILSILQKEEPLLFSGENDIEVDIEKLKTSTLAKLANFVLSNSS